MAHSPAFYHQILRDVFKGENENKPPDGPHERARARWRLSYSLLRSFSTIPGLTPTGIDAQTLRLWIDRVRELGRETDRMAVTERNIGRAHGKGVFEGGDQERQLAEEYRRYGAIAEAWPHTSALLTAIAKGWDRDAERADVEAAQRKLRS